MAAAEAYTLFQTSCSTPPLTTQVNFVSSPDSRGTLDILWSSLFTIVACTWTVQHLNVPEQRNGRDPGWVGSLRWKLKGFLTSAKWMLITVIAPEVVITTASSDLFEAKSLGRKLQRFALEDNVPWTLSHTYFANMGGFVIQSDVQDPHATPYITAKSTPTNNHPDTTTFATADSNASQERKIVEPKENSLPATISENGQSRPYRNPYHLKATQIYKLRKERVLPKLPHISKEELEDKSKSDSFVKTIAIFQIIWAVIQIIVRTARKLAISQLELAVIAFATCAVVIYILYWSKPKSPSTTITILQYRDQIPKDVLKLIEVDVGSRLGFVLDFSPETRVGRDGSRILNDEVDEDGDSAFPMSLRTTLFGGIHIGAWNFNFPSRIELIFWRCASLYSAAFIIVFVLSAFVGNLISKLLGKETNKFPILLSMFLYVVARLYLLVEVFRTLCFLPSDAYIATWATNIPHVG